LLLRYSLFSFKNKVLPRLYARVGYAVDNSSESRAAKDEVEMQRGTNRLATRRRQVLNIKSAAAATEEKCFVTAKSDAPDTLPKCVLGAFREQRFQHLTSVECFSHACVCSLPCSGSF